MLHGLSYSTFFKTIQRRYFKDGVELIEVNPAYSSKAAKKYPPKMKLTVHWGSAWMIARRAIGYRITVKKYRGQIEHEKQVRQAGKKKKRKQAACVSYCLTKIKHTS